MIDSQNEQVLRVFQTKDETKAFYNKIAGVYDLLSDRAEKPVRLKGLELLAAAPGEQILEIGCGTGHCLAAIAKAVQDHGYAIGVDLSEKMISIAQKTLQKENLLNRAEFHCGDAIHLPYNSESTDGIFMVFTLELFDTPEIPLVLNECKRVLRPEGRIVVAGISKEGKQGVLIHAFEWTHRHFPNLMDCRPIYVRQVLEDAGFTIKKSIKKQMWIPTEIVLAMK